MSRLAAAVAAGLLAAQLAPIPGFAGDPDPLDSANHRKAPRPPTHVCPGSPQCDDLNGISVDTPKVYDNRTLQTQLGHLAGQLSMLTGFDQASLTSRFGALQGASSSQLSGSLQLLGAPIPATTTTSLTGTPQVAQTNSVVGVASATPTTTTTNQTVSTQPSNTVQTVATGAAYAPSAPALPSASGYASPTAFNVSSLDALAEEMQLSYQMVDLQLLLQGSLGDDYSRSGLAKRHVTLGFPISVSTLPQYRGDVAEVEVSICNPAERADATPPTLQTILPQEKTYNVASLTTHSAGLGVGAVIAGAANVGGSFLWSHQTLYLVRDQDTVALQRDSGDTQLATCPVLLRQPDPPTSNDDQSQDAAIVAPPTAADAASAEDLRNDEKHAAMPVTFAWQFRPVLGRSAVEGGLRPTFAQVSLAPTWFPPEGDGPNDLRKIQVTIRTCWRRYDANRGIVGETIERSCSPRKVTMVPIIFDTTNIDDIVGTDNGDGTLNVEVHGAFPAGTQVAIGDAYVAVVDQVLERDDSYLRFTAPAQLAAIHGIRVVSPDGAQQDVSIELPDPFELTPKVTNGVTTGYILAGPFLNGTTVNLGDKSFKPMSEEAAGALDRGTIYIKSSSAVSLKSLTFIGPDRAAASDCPGPRSGDPKPDLHAKVVTYSATLSRITFDAPPVCPLLDLQQDTYPPVVILAGKAFGLSDAPFEKNDGRAFSLLVPTTLVQGQSRMVFKRLFLDRSYQATYQLKSSDTTITSLTLLNSSGGDKTYLATGTDLSKVTLAYPQYTTDKISHVGSTIITFTIPIKDAGAKQFIFRTQPYDPHETYEGGFAVQSVPSDDSEKTGDDTAKVKFDPVTVPLNSSAAFQITGSGLKLVSAIDYQDKALPIALGPKAAFLSVTPAAGMTAMAGTVALKLILVDGSTLPLSVAVQSQ